MSTGATILGTLLLLQYIIGTESQVCSPPGQLCKSASDCCRGCCEQYICVERGYSCSSDLVPQPGSSSCVNFHCPRNTICYMRQVCPDENPCPKMPFCRTVKMRQNSTDYPEKSYATSLSVAMYTLIFSMTLLVIF